jgi:transposase
VARYTFRGKRPTRAKVLWWDRNGCCLLYKRLHRALFDVPHGSAVVPSIQISASALAELLAGVAKEEKRRVAA